MNRRSLPSAIALLAIVADCSDSRSPSDKATSGSTPAMTNAAVRIHRDRDFALDPTKPPFHLAIDAAGPNVDSLTVRLRVHSPDQKLVYRAEWDLPSERLKGVRTFIGQLAAVAAKASKAA